MKSERKYRKRQKGATSRNLTFRAAPDLDERITRLADEQDVSISRIVDQLIRRGIDAQEIVDVGALVASVVEDRIERSLGRLEARSSGFCGQISAETSFIDFEAEQILIAAALGSAKPQLPQLSLLDHEAFSSGWSSVHPETWRIIKDGLVRPGARASHNAASILEGMQVSLKAGGLRLAEYLARLQSCSQIAAMYADNAAHRVLAAAVRRQRSGFTPQRLPTGCDEDPLSTAVYLKRFEEKFQYFGRPWRYAYGDDPQIHNLRRTVLQTYDDVSDLTGRNDIDPSDTPANFITRTARQLGVPEPLVRDILIDANPDLKWQHEGENPPLPASSRTKG